MAADFFLGKVTALGVLCCFALLFVWPCLLLSSFLFICHEKMYAIVYTAKTTQAMLLQLQPQILLSSVSLSAMILECVDS